MNNLEMIKGTGGGLDYLVVAKPKGFIIGIKPMFQHQQNRTFVGMRVRMIIDPLNEIPLINPKEALVNVFPQVKWVSFNSERVSLVGGAVVGINHKDTKALDNWFMKEDIPKVLFENLLNLFGADELILQTIFRDYFSNSFLEEFKLLDVIEGDGNTVVSMSDYQKELNKPDAGTEIDEFGPDADEAQDDIDYPDTGDNKDE